MKKRNRFTFAPLFEILIAGVAELVDAYVSGAYAERCGGSSPPSRTGFKLIAKELCENITPFFMSGKAGTPHSSPWFEYLTRPFTRSRM